MIFLPFEPTSPGNTQNSNRNSLLLQYEVTREPRLRDRLVREHQKLVYFVARRFLGRGEPLEDLIQVGNIGLIHAIDRYRSNAYSQFTTFAMPTIAGEIKRYFRDKTAAMRIPRTLMELDARINATRHSLEQRLLRPPRTAEIAAELGVTEELILEAMDARALVFNMTSLDAHGQSEDGDSFGRECVGQQDTTFETVESRVDLTHALNVLDDPYRQVIVLIFYHGLNQAQVAGQLGISQMHVSRLQRRALKTMREVMLT